MAASAPAPPPPDAAAAANNASLAAVRAGSATAMEALTADAAGNGRGGSATNVARQSCGEPQPASVPGLTATYAAASQRRYRARVRVSAHASHARSSTSASQAGAAGQGVARTQAAEAAAVARWPRQQATQNV